MRPPHPPAGPKVLRQRTILELVAAVSVGSQEDLAELLRLRGFDVTQATVSRDVAELGLAKVARDDGHVYVAAGQVSPPGAGQDLRLARLLAQLPVTIGRSGLSLVLTATPGTAGAIAQAIDQSSLDDQVGTLAGDNTLLVLFADDARLERWLQRFEALQRADARADDRGALRHARPAPRARSASNGAATPGAIAASRTMMHRRPAQGVPSRAATTGPDTIQLATDPATEMTR